MKIVVATDSFKGSLSAEKACSIIAAAIAEHLPAVRVVEKPMADGGEGTAKAMIAARNGEWIPRTAMGPLPEMEVEAGFAWFGDTRTALVEMACASGIELLEREQLNPLKTTTYGTGQLIECALGMQPDEILLAVGGSATVDAGIGAAMALGWKFADGQGNAIGLGGGEIERIEKIIPPPDKIDCKVKVLSDVDNPLCGQNGATKVFGPQKGADPDMVERLDSAIGKLSGRIQADLGIEVRDLPGAGAAGGLAAGAVAFMNAEIVSGIDTIIKECNLEAELHDADWIMTGEGKFDDQSLNGKVISGVVQMAKQTNTKVVVIAGEVQLGSEQYSEFGITAAFSLKKEDMATEYAMRNSEKLLKQSVREFMETVQ
ncbi:MAG: glycerate kinase [Verrucomicrobiota bacterium]